MTYIIVAKGGIYMSQGGNWGKLLRVNLADQSYTIEDIPEKLFKQYMGGTGLAIKYLADEVDPSIDPLGKDNKLTFAIGPLTGTLAPCASRMSVITKSPLTGAVGNSLTGGYFPAELKFAGYDMLIIEGVASEHLYLTINESKISFRSTKKVWGLNTIDTEQVIKDELNNQNYRVACIGPAGEKMIKMASIINERHASGRKGVGAVMGSKNF